MSSNKGLRRAYFMTIILLAVGVVCYAAFPKAAPENPVRMMFKNTAGKVLFTHKIHADDSGYALSCLDCHHHYEEDGAEFKACGDCHGSSKMENAPASGQIIAGSLARPHLSNRRRRGSIDDLGP